MSHKHSVISDSSEEEATTSPPPPPPKKRQRKTPRDAPEEPRGLLQAVAVAKKANEMLAASGQHGEIFVQTMAGQRVDCDESGKITFTKTPTDTYKYQWQKAMEIAMQILGPLKVDTKELTLLPDSGTLECFKKAGQAYMNNTRTIVNYNFTTQKTFLHMLGRLLLDFVLKAANVQTKTNCSGCVIWEHGCQSQLQCLHGKAMIQKEQLVEMDVNSENAQRVLKETPEKAKIVANRWGRNVVQIKNQDAFCCFMDVHMNGGAFSGGSCGMFYTDGTKALTAFHQFMAFQKASYPKMVSAETHMLIPLKCECNWNSPLPLLGRQTCKVTPFSLQATLNVDKEQITDPKMLATLQHPAILVFQCCNPVYRNTKASVQKNCDFKMSTVDMMACVQIAKQLWQVFTQTPPPLKYPEFKWGSEYKYQNTILPQGQEDKDDSLF
nr:DBP [Skunk adenovirus 1]